MSSYIVTALTLTFAIISIIGFNHVVYAQNISNTTEFEDYTNQNLGLSLKIPTDWTIFAKENKYD